MEQTNNGIKIIVACHKQYWQSNDSVYCYIEAGAAKHDRSIPGMLRDDTGDNISEKNDRFCELTALYWAWKNTNSDYLGLCHYRRYFGQTKTGAPEKRILSGDTLRNLLQKTDVILPKPRNYWIETNYSQYVHAHHEQDLILLREILQQRFPEYLPAYDQSMARTTGHRFNMFIMRRDIADAYCAWLFDILFELEKRLDISQYDARSRRVFGYVAERLIDAWLETNGISYKELPVVNLERQNWLVKVARFLLRKLKGKID